MSSVSENPVPPITSNPSVPTTPPVNPPATTTASSPPVNPSPDPPNPTQDPDPPSSTGGGGGGGVTKPTRTGGGGGKPRPTTTSGGGGIPNPSQGTDPSNGDKDGGDSGGSKFPTAAVIGSLAGVLVLAFLVGVFVMRYRRRKSAQKRLDALFDSNNNPGAVQSVLNNNKHRPESLNSSRPSNAGPSRPSNVEMTAIGGAAGAAGARPGLNNNTGDYYNAGYAAQQHGYPPQNQVPYGAYQEQYDQYGYPATSQAAAAYGGYPAGAAAGGYYDQQQQQEYPPTSAPGGYYRNSPSMAHATAYPPPPPGAVGASPRASYQPPPKSAGTPTLSSTAISSTSPLLSDTPGTAYAEAVGSGSSPALNKVELSEAEKARLAQYGRAPQAILPDDQNQIKVPVE